MVTSPTAPASLLLRLAPAIFVVIWATGWIVAKYAAPFSDPLTFLAIRYALSALVLSGLALTMASIWPREGRIYLHCFITGAMINAIYHGGVWWAVAHGLPAGVSALIAALQPILAAVLAYPLLGERISLVRGLGVFVGLVGISLVLAPKLVGVDVATLDMVLGAIGINVIGMVSITLGTFYQKRFLPACDLVTTNALQNAGAALVMLCLAASFEQMRFDVNTTTVMTMVWSVLVLSIGAVWLLLMMINAGSVARVSALIYLVPPVASVQAFFLFGETLTLIQIAGLITTALGVYLATRR